MDELLFRAQDLKSPLGVIPFSPTAIRMYMYGHVHVHVSINPTSRLVTVKNVRSADVCE